MIKEITKYVDLNNEEIILINKINKRLSLLEYKVNDFLIQNETISFEAIKKSFVPDDKIQKITKNNLNQVNQFIKKIDIILENKVYSIVGSSNLKEEKRKITIEINRIRNTLDKLGLLYLEKDKQAVLNQLNNLVIFKKLNSFKNNDKKITVRYHYQLNKLKELVENKEIINMDINQSDFDFFNQLDILDKPWTFWENKVLLFISIIIFIVVFVIIGVTIWTIII
ncbi:MAG: hypothetical protein GQ557_00050 [Mycoplasmataceae bacterium]|nr:hypothetical protein [Mycoplasmataceae bacterium]